MWLVWNDNHYYQYAEILGIPWSNLTCWKDKLQATGFHVLSVFSATAGHALLANLNFGARSEDETYWKEFGR